MLNVYPYINNKNVGASHPEQSTGSWPPPPTQAQRRQVEIIWSSNNTPLIPTGIQPTNFRFQLYVKQRPCAVVNSPFKKKYRTELTQRLVPIYQSLLWGPETQRVISAIQNGN